MLYYMKKKKKNIQITIFRSLNSMYTIYINTFLYQGKQLDTHSMTLLKMQKQQRNFTVFVIRKAQHLLYFK